MLHSPSEDPGLSSGGQEGGPEKTWDAG